MTAGSAGGFTDDDLQNFNRESLDETDELFSPDFALKRNSGPSGNRFVQAQMRKSLESPPGEESDEDGELDKAQPIYPSDTAVERITAGVEAMNALDFDFKLTGRCENFLRGNPDLEDTIRRLQAYEAAGAKVLMAPGLPDLDAVRAVCDAVSTPFNFMVGIPGKSFTFAGLQEAGVRRISLATSLYRAAISAMIDAAKEVRDEGTFGFVDTSSPTPGCHFRPR